MKYNQTFTMATDNSTLGRALSKYLIWSSSVSVQFHVNGQNVLEVFYIFVLMLLHTFGISSSSFMVFVEVATFWAANLSIFWRKYLSEINFY